MVEPAAGEMRRTMSDDGGNCWEELRDDVSNAGEGARLGVAMRLAQSHRGSMVIKLGTGRWLW